MTAAGPVAPQPPLIPNYVLLLAVYILYLVGFATVITFLVGVIVAYQQRGKTDSVCESHIQFQIRTFWMAVLLGLLVALTVGGGLTPGASGLLVVICGVISIVLFFLLLTRCVKGFLTLNTREPIHNPKSWWLGERPKAERPR